MHTFEQGDVGTLINITAPRCAGTPNSRGDGRLRQVRGVPGTSQRGRSQLVTDAGVHVALSTITSSGASGSSVVGSVNALAHLPAVRAAAVVEHVPSRGGGGGRRRRAVASTNLLPVAVDVVLQLSASSGAAADGFLSILAYVRACGLTLAQFATVALHRPAQSDGGTQLHGLTHDAGRGHGGWLLFSSRRSTVVTPSSASTERHLVPAQSTVTLSTPHSRWSHDDRWSQQKGDQATNQNRLFDLSTTTYQGRWNFFFIFTIRPLILSVALRFWWGK